MRKLKNILVTGGSGFIGSNFIHYLFKNNFQGKIINLDCLTYAGNPDNLKSIEKNKNIKGKKYFFEKVNICDRHRLEKIFRKYQIDTVVHFAAESHVDRSIQNPKKFIETNITGTFTLLDVAKNYWDTFLSSTKEEFLFHHISTDEVYGSLPYTGTFTEESPLNPSSPYSASKAACEEILFSYFYTYGMPVTISNCSNNYGPYQFPEKLIPLMITNILSKKELPLYGSGKNIRDWIYVEDHISAICKILKSGRPGQKYNISASQELSNIEVLEKIIQVVSKKTKEDCQQIKKRIVFVKDRPGHDFRYAMDSSKIQNELLWQPKYSFEEGLEKTVDWYLENTGWTKRLLKTKS